MQLGRAALTAVLLLVLAGCAEHWAKPGATALERDAALARCDAESHARFPPALQTIMLSPGYFVPPQTRCWTQNNQTHCNTSGGFWVPPSYHTIDHNYDARRAARLDCMYSAGWMLAKDEKEAEAVTKSAPPIAPPIGQPPAGPSPAGPPAVGPDVRPGRR